jgi:hypothetical protein
LSRDAVRNSDWQREEMDEKQGDAATISEISGGDSGVYDSFSEDFRSDSEQQRADGGEVRDEGKRSAARRKNGEAHPHRQSLQGAVSGVGRTRALNT